MSKAALLAKQKQYEEWKRKRDQSEAEKVRPNPVVETSAPIESEERRRKREENRRKYPELAAWVDDVRKVFPDAQVISIKEYTPEQTAERKRCMELGLPMPDFD